MFYYHPHTGRFEQNSRSVRASSVFTPRTTRYSYDEGYVPYSRPLYSSYGRYDSTGEENLNRSQINRNLILSSAALDDNYDISVRSRNRDRDVLASANRAIVDTEIHSSPRSAVAARRVMRGQSTPPSAFQSKREVHAALARAKYNNVGYTVPPASAKHQHTRSVRVTINPRYRFTLPKKTGRWHQSYQKAKETTSQTDIEGLRRAPLSILAYLRNLELRLKSKRFRPSNTTFVPVRSAYTKAALIGSRVDVVSPDSGVRRRPRSVYAQTKVRQLESSKRLKDGSPVAVVAERTTDLKASRPVQYARPRRIWERELDYYFISA